MNKSFEPNSGTTSGGSRKVEEIKDSAGHTVYVVPPHPEIASEFVPPNKIRYDNPPAGTSRSNVVVYAKDWYPMLEAQRAKPHPLVLAIKSITSHLPHPHRA